MLLFIPGSLALPISLVWRIVLTIQLIVSYFYQIVYLYSLVFVPIIHTLLSHVCKCIYVGWSWFNPDIGLLTPMPHCLLKVSLSIHCYVLFINMFICYLVFIKMYTNCVIVLDKVFDISINDVFTS